MKMSNRRLVNSGRAVDSGRLVIEHSQELLKRTREENDRRKAAERRRDGAVEFEC